MASTASFIVSGSVTVGDMSSEGTPSTPFTLTRPLVNQVVQRNGSNIGLLPVAGATASGTLAIARVIPINGFAGTQSNFQSLTIAGGNVSGTIQAAPGWYTLEIKIYNGTTYLSRQTISPVGVGDVFITSGQSNATNYAQPIDTTVPVSVAVVSRGITGGNLWLKATDPQPTADNVFSSPWPRLGDQLFNHTGFPVAFISVGVGNTAIADWLPAGSNYPRITSAINLLSGANGFRAFLWHQGENDASLSTSQASYTTSLHSIIDQIRTDAGWTVPCGIAIATHPNEISGAGVIAAQTDVGTHYPSCFLGANTDTLDNTYRQVDHVHFNTTTGTAAHANLWYNAIVSQFSI